MYISQEERDAAKAKMQRIKLLAAVKDTSSKKDPIEQLDRVLTFMCTSHRASGRISDADIQIGLKSEGYEIGGGDLVDVIDQLLEDKYLNIKEIKAKNAFQYDHVTYRATWAGKYFQRTSGYRKKIEIDGKNVVLEKRNERYLRYGAIGAAIGSIAIFVLEMTKYLESHKIYLF